MGKTHEDHNPVYVTKPFLPPLKEFIPYLEKIWENRILTNNGPFHEELEQKLCEYLGVEYISLFSNGTLALMTALKILDISGEVITTPFSFVATTHALWWNNIKPVFIDIENSTFNLDPDKIVAAITPETSAILPVHVFGNPCNVEKIRDIASGYGLKVIYDAAHAFGVKWKEIPVVSFGDLSVLSFHATKVYNTFEGGAIVCHDEATKKKIDNMKNFGFADETTVIDTGINAKMNEFQAAIGLLQLKHINEIIEKRSRIAEQYRHLLINIDGVSYIENLPEVKHCYSYFPVFIEEKRYGRSRDAVYEELKMNNIYSRRYYYPLISQFPAYSKLESAQPGRMPVAERVTDEVLCLPIYPDMDTLQIKKICSILEGN
jgi:dTDP-4-amino-4,6-dideoxygalactose transaminase